MNFKIAILGRPNVGKSTLFNRLCGFRSAIVGSTPGITRDRRIGIASLGDLRFEIIDTAGFEESPEGSIEHAMQEQTKTAITQANAIIFLVDARAGITPVDRHFAGSLQKSPLPVILVVNKCEGKTGIETIYEAFELGLGDPTSISAEHGNGLVDLYNVISPLIVKKENNLGENNNPKIENGPLKMAIVGRPNVGKSTLFNTLLKEERAITSPEPGVTRDSISVDWEWEKEQIKLYDTAGMRRNSRVKEKIEKLSIGDTLRAIKFSQVSVLLLDGTLMAERQDLNIAEHIIEEGRALLIAVNKWDLIADRALAIDKLNDRLERSLPQIRGVPIVRISALNGFGVDRLMPAVKQIYNIWVMRLPTGPLNRWLENVIEDHPPPLLNGKRLRLRYITQIKGRPPTFVIFCSRPSKIPESYKRYLVNSLRETFNIDGVPIRLFMRAGKNPYSKDA